jgi:hypothetical protein
MSLYISALLLLAIVIGNVDAFQKKDLMKAVDKSDNAKVREILAENPELKDVRDKVRYDVDV